MSRFRRDVLPGVVLAVLVVAMVVGGWLFAAVVRDHRIESCEDRGGQALTADWWAGHYMDVRCVEPAVASMSLDVAKKIGWPLPTQTWPMVEDYTVDDLLTWLRASDARLSYVEIYDDAREDWDVWLHFHDDSYYTDIEQHPDVQVGGHTLLEALEKAVLKVAATREGWPIDRSEASS